MLISLSIFVANRKGHEGMNLILPRQKNLKCTSAALTSPVGNMIHGCRLPISYPQMGFFVQTKDLSWVNQVEIFT